MALFDEELPAKKRVHQIGEDLASLSLDELAERIMLLREEIGRIEEAIRQKQASSAAAEAFFKK